mmetsp:Transcript_6605/g.14372  ORF Transcript_6605/g.14372 Transcript_6605/m.14372 type:complete len:1049 (+) Transcript_6605:90-3236(+)
MPDQAESLLDSIQELQRLSKVGASIEQQVWESVRNGFEEVVKSVMMEAIGKLLDVPARNGAGGSYAEVVYKVMNAATTKLLTAVDGLQGVMKASAGKSPLQAASLAVPATAEPPHHLPQARLHAAHDGASTRTSTGHAGRTGQPQDFFTPMAAGLSPSPVEFASTTPGEAVQSSSQPDRGAALAGAVPDSWNWASEQAARLAEESSAAADAELRRSSASEAAGLADSTVSEQAPADDEARSNTASPPVSNPGARRSILKISLPAAETPASASPPDSSGAGSFKLRMTPEQLEGVQNEQDGKRRGTGRSVRLGHEVETVITSPRGNFSPRGNLSPRSRDKAPASPRLSGLSDVSDVDVLSPRSRGGREAMGRRATLPCKAAAAAGAIAAEHEAPEMPFGRRMTAPALLQNPYTVLEELEGTMKVIHRFFCDPVTMLLDAKGLEAMIAAQGTNSELLPDTPEEALEYIYDYIEVEAEDTVDFLCLYDFVHACLNDDQGLVKRWVEHLSRHAHLTEMQRDAADYFQVLSPRLTKASASSAARHRMLLAAAGAVEEEAIEYPAHATLTEALESFLAKGDDPRRVCHDFAAILKLGNVSSAGDQQASYPEIRDTLVPNLNFKMAAIFRTLDKRIKEEGAKRKHGLYIARPLEGLEVVVCGAGPVGLRCAVEMQMLGAKVVVLEKRKGFSRHNILHLWDWVLHDLLSLGAKVLYPKFGSGAAFLHIGTRQLQNLLLKVALLLGIDVRFGTEFQKLLPPNAGAQKWAAEISSASGDNLPAVPCDLVVDCAGPRGSVCRECSFDFKVAKMSEAVGLVVNFVHSGSREERLLKEFSWARQFNAELFDTLAGKGADLENVVYYQGETHYFVMTPKRSSLVSYGALTPKEGASAKETSLGQFTENVPKLREYARQVASHFGIPGSCDFVEDPKLFDFSSRRSASEAIRLISPQQFSEDGSTAVEGPLLPVALAGDCLLEPFWPEGLGITRGFLSVLDLGWACAKGLRASGDAKNLVQMRQKTVKLLKSLGSFTRGQIIQDDVRAFSLDPATRYKGLLQD